MLRNLAWASLSFFSKELFLASNWIILNWSSAMFLNVRRPSLVLVLTVAFSTPWYVTSLGSFTTPQDIFGGVTWHRCCWWQGLLKGAHWTCYFFVIISDIWKYLRQHYVTSFIQWVSWFHCSLLGCHIRDVCVEESRIRWYSSAGCHYSVGSCCIFIRGEKMNCGSYDVNFPFDDRTCFLWKEKNVHEHCLTLWTAETYERKKGTILSFSCLSADDNVHWFFILIFAVKGSQRNPYTLQVTGMR